MTTLGTRVYEARITKNISQDTLAQLVDVSRTQIINIEHDRSSTTVATLKGLSKALAVTSDYLLGLE